jgi:hypothetical protein
MAKGAAAAMVTGPVTSFGPRKKGLAIDAVYEPDE